MNFGFLICCSLFKKRSDYVTDGVAPNRRPRDSSHHVDDVERVADEVGILVNGRFAVQGTVDELRNRIKRIRIVLPDGKLPVRVPSEGVFQKLSRREWIVTVDPFSDALFENVQSENDAVSADVIELNLEEIFKDVVRGQKPQSEEAKVD